MNIVIYQSQRCEFIAERIKISKWLNDEYVFSVHNIFNPSISSSDFSDFHMYHMYILNIVEFFKERKLLDLYANVDHWKILCKILKFNGTVDIEFVQDIINGNFFDKIKDINITGRGLVTSKFEWGSIKFINNAFSNKDKNFKEIFCKNEHNLYGYNGGIELINKYLKLLYAQINELYDFYKQYLENRYIVYDEDIENLTNKNVDYIIINNNNNVNIKKLCNKVNINKLFFLRDNFQLSDLKCKELFLFNPQCLIDYDASEEIVIDIKLNILNYCNISKLSEKFMKCFASVNIFFSEYDLQEHLINMLNGNSCVIEQINCNIICYDKNFDTIDLSAKNFDIMGLKSERPIIAGPEKMKNIMKAIKEYSEGIIDLYNIITSKGNDFFMPIIKPRLNYVLQKYSFIFHGDKIGTSQIFESNNIFAFYSLFIQLRGLLDELDNLRSINPNHMRFNTQLDTTIENIYKNRLSESRVELDLIYKSDFIFVNLWSYGDEGVYPIKDAVNLVFMSQNKNKILIKLPKNVESVYFKDHIGFDNLAFDKGKESCNFKCDKLRKVYVNYSDCNDFSKIVDNVSRLLKIAPNLDKLSFILKDNYIPDDIKLLLTKMNKKLNVEFLSHVDILTIVDKQEIKSQGNIFKIRLWIFFSVCVVVICIFLLRNVEGFNNNSSLYKINDEIKFNEYHL